jgi:hypothetical protein
MTDKHIKLFSNTIIDYGSSLDDARLAGIEKKASISLKKEWRRETFLP